MDHSTDTDYNENSAPRCPVILCLDNSYSMQGAPINQLNAGVAQLFSELQEDDIAKYSVEIAIINFGGSAELKLPFTPLDNPAALEIPTLVPCGNTPLGSALEIAHGEIEKRRQYYSEEGIAAYKPWLILMSDGYPNDNWHSSADKLKNMALDGKLNYLGIGIGDQLNMSDFGDILPDRMPPKKLDGMKFTEFFQWLSDSLKAVSNSAGPGSSVEIPETDGWASLSC